MGSAPASLADNPFLITLLLEMQTTILLRTEISRKTEYVHNPCFLSANILKILGVFAENQNYNFNSEEVNKSIYDWEDRLWKIFPSEIKALERFNLNLFVDKNGRVFTVEFSMPDEAFQQLEGFPKNTLKNFYHNLIKEECKTFKKVDFQVLDPDSEGGRQILLDVCGSFGSGNEYTTIFLNKSCYDIFGTFSPWRLPKDEFNRLIKKNEAEMNSQQTDK